MDRYISSNTRTMNSVSSVSRFEHVVGVAILRVPALIACAGSLLAQDAVGMGSKPGSRQRLRPGLKRPGTEFAALQPTWSLRPSRRLAAFFRSL